MQPDVAGLLHFIEVRLQFGERAGQPVGLQRIMHGGRYLAGCVLPGPGIGEGQGCRDAVGREEHIALDGT